MLTADRVERHFAHARRGMRQLRFAGHIADGVDIRQIGALLLIDLDAAAIEVELNFLKSHAGKVRDAADRHQDDVRLN